ncbi:MAG: hypothetical protein JRH10_21820 [Deltaproteobacteria bacterium]|nr:hypothetical protein [Deltaproteobacteria bacterium]MBW2448547.1 hypothetical protein [Deltaproteobacteria bacterium]
MVTSLLEPSEEEAIRSNLLENIGHAFRVTFRYFDAIPLGPGGKSGSVISELDR